MNTDTIAPFVSFFSDANKGSSKTFVRPFRQAKGTGAAVVTKTLESRTLAKVSGVEFLKSIPPSKCDGYQDFAKISRKIVTDTGRSTPRFFFMDGNDAIIFYKGTQPADTPLYSDDEGNFYVDVDSKKYFARISSPGKDIIEFFAQMGMKEIS